MFDELNQIGEQILRNLEWVGAIHEQAAFKTARGIRKDLQLYERAVTMGKTLTDAYQLCLRGIEEQYERISAQWVSITAKLQQIFNWEVKE